jgi:hypothetical protein
MITRAQITAGQPPLASSSESLANGTDPEFQLAQADIDALLSRSYTPGQRNVVLWKIEGLDPVLVTRLFNLYSTEWLVTAEIDPDADGGHLCFFWDR